MILTQIAIIVGIAVVMQVLGFVWYGPLFGKTWARVMGLPPASSMTKEENKAFRARMVPTYITSFVLSIVTTWVLTSFIGILAGFVLGGSLFVGLLVWLGFVMPIVAGGALWSGKPRTLAWKMFWITAGYQFVSIFLSILLLSWFV